MLCCADGEGEGNLHASQFEDVIPDSRYRFAGMMFPGSPRCAASDKSCAEAWERG